jgi:predicted dehydrogenase
VDLLEPAYTGQEYLLHEFYEAVTQGKPAGTTGADNLHSLAMVFQALQSFDTSLPVRFD